MQLFKYFPNTEYALDALRKREIWMAAPTSFNDPFEMRLMMPDSNPAHIRGVKESRAQNPQYSSMSDADFFQILFNANQEQLNSLGVACFSENNDSILMWSHYTNSHRGFCLGFEVQDEPKDRGVHEVEYTTRYPPLDFLNIHDSQGLWRIILTKSDQWKYEKEWRVIHTKNNYLVPYQFNLKQVIFGALADKKLKDEIHSIVGHDEIKLRMARLHNSRYQLEIVDF